MDKYTIVIDNSTANTILYNWYYNEHKYGSIRLTNSTYVAQLYGKEYIDYHLVETLMRYEGDKGDAMKILLELQTKYQYKYLLHTFNKKLEQYYIKSGFKLVQSKNIIYYGKINILCFINDILFV